MLVLIMIEALSLQPHSNHLGPYRITKNCTAQYKMCRETKITLVHVGVAVLGDPSNSFGFPLGFRLKLPQQGSPQQRTQTYQCAVWACGSLEFPQNPPGCGWIELPDNASQQTKSLVSPIGARFAWLGQFGSHVLPKEVRCTARFACGQRSSFCG